MRPQPCTFICLHSVQIPHYFEQFYGGIVLGFLRQPSLYLMSDMKRTPQQNRLRTYFPHCPQDTGGSVACYVLYPYAYGFDVAQVLFQFAQYLALGQPVQYSHLDVAIPIENQTDLVGEICPVD